MTRQRSRLPQWPAALAWYQRECYDQAATLTGLEWHALLVERLRAWTGDPAAAQAYLQHVQRAPLSAQTALISSGLPLQSLAFEDLDWLRRLAAQPAIEQAEAQWRAQPPYADRVLRTVLTGAELEAVNPVLHDHQLALVRSAGAGCDRRWRDTVRLAYLRVDLATPDGVLTEMLRRWLTERRAQLEAAGFAAGAAPLRSRKPVARIGSQQFQSWASLRVLDYLDLRLACRVAGIAEPSAQLFGAKLFPDDRARRPGHAQGRVDTTDRFTQQTKPLANQLMTAEFLDGLHEQLVGEFWLSPDDDAEAGDGAPYPEP